MSGNNFSKNQMVALESFEDLCNELGIPLGDTNRAHRLLSIYENRQKMNKTELLKMLSYPLPWAFKAYFCAELYNRYGIDRAQANKLVRGIKAARVAAKAE